jgi:hypothetical protein
MISGAMDGTLLCASEWGGSSNGKNGRPEEASRYRPNPDAWLTFIPAQQGALYSVAGGALLLKSDTPRAFPRKPPHLSLYTPATDLHI